MNLEIKYNIQYVLILLNTIYCVLKKLKNRHSNKFLTLIMYINII